MCSCTWLLIQSIVSVNASGIKTMQTEMVGPSHRFCCYAKVARKLSSFSVCITDLSHTLCDLYKCHICTYDSKIFSVYHRKFICRCSVFFPNVHEVSADCDKVYQ